MNMREKVSQAMKIPLHLKLLHFDEAIKRDTKANINRIRYLHQRLLHAISTPISADDLIKREIWIQNMAMENRDDAEEFAWSVFDMLGENAQSQIHLELDEIKEFYAKLRKRFKNSFML
ncbi:hypothetical protein EXS70_01670 [Candidatus Peribacteria bacterium]|nr:hypothetical protein [Candidatus Peribacteria bacterium]